ncbi:MAG: hypothetical protein O3A65_07520 [Proteobacteria bacterium]|nr:hypothetical protein [Pseudomonadota bacterium]
MTNKLAAVLMLLFTSICFAKSDYLKAWKRDCDNGDSNACFNLGLVYYTGGEGITQDYFKAAAYSQKGCEGGEALACYNLGLAYENGNGVTQDYSKAIEAYKKGYSGGRPPRATKDIKPLEISIDSAPPPLGDENDAKAFYEYAKNKLFDKGSYKEAINLFYALNEKFPDNQYAKSGMYWAAIGLNKEPGQSQQALTVLTQLLPRLKNHNKHCAAMLEAGIIHVERGECSAAGKYLIEAEKICSSDQEATNQMLAQIRLAELKRRCAP